MLSTTEAVKNKVMIEYFEQSSHTNIYEYIEQMKKVNPKLFRIITEK